MAKTIDEINDAYCALFYQEDRKIIPMMCAAIINAKIPNTPPIWVTVVGPSSGGKSALLSIFAKVPFVTQVSDVTPNTFLSGMSSSNGSETSLLKKLGNNFVMIMKDFTTILSKSEETQGPILAQMREIYDGHIKKETGVGKTIEWGSKEKPWKGTFIMAATEAIYVNHEKFADMGTRAVNYVLQDQDRIKTVKRSMKHDEAFQSKLSDLQDMTREYIIDKLLTLPERLPDLDEAFEDEIIEIGNFGAMCRSVVVRDYKGAPVLALSTELPMRLCKQLKQTAQVLIYMNGGDTCEDIRKTVFKMALDSIPKQSRIALRILAADYQMDTAWVARSLNYPDKRAKEWIENLNMFHIVDRVKRDRIQYWEMKQEYRNLMCKYDGVELSNDWKTGSTEDEEKWTDDY